MEGFFNGNLKIHKRYSTSNFFFAGVLLTGLCLIKCSTGKRFDIDNNFGMIEEYDIPELIEINKVEPINPMEANKRPGKPKPEFELPQMPHAVGMSSSWSLGSALGSSYFPSFAAHKPPGAATPSHESSNSMIGGSADTTFFHIPAQSHAQGLGIARPPRPPPYIASNVLTESTYSSPTWATQPQNPPVLPQQPPRPPPASSPSWSSPPQPQSPPVFLQEQSPSSPVSSQAPTGWPSQAPPSSPSTSWIAETPPSSGQSPSWVSESSPAPAPYPTSWSQPPPSAYAPPQSQWSSVQQPSSASWSQPPPSNSAIAQAPQWSAQPPPQQPSWSSDPYQSSQPSKPFSLYQQLNLHLLEPSTWDKLQDQKDQWQTNFYKPPPQLQQQHQQQANQLLVAPPQSPAPNPINFTPNVSFSLPEELLVVGYNNHNNNSGITSSGHNEILDPVDGIVDYTHPGQKPLSNNDDDKFFDNDDDFVTVDNDEDEIMKMVE